MCLNYTKMNSGSAKAVHLSRYVEKDEGEAEETNKELSNVEKGEGEAYFGQRGRRRRMMVWLIFTMWW